MEDKVTILYSKEILEEYKRVLIQDRIIKLTGFSKKILSQIIFEITYLGEIVETTSDFKIVRDPSDDKFLNCAVDGRAQYIVSRDKDLLTFERFEGISIVDDKEFLARYEQLNKEYGEY